MTGDPRAPRFFKFNTGGARRAWAFAAILSGCVIFTLFAAVGVWLISGNELYSLILALAAHVQILVGMSAFAFLLGRRLHLEVDRDGMTISDVGGKAEDAAANAAQHVADSLDGGN